MFTKAKNYIKRNERKVTLTCLVVSTAAAVYYKTKLAEESYYAGIVAEAVDRMGVEDAMLDKALEIIKENL